MVLNGRNFDTMTQKIAHILVEVYAPWCGHCQKFEPIYRKAASQFRLNEVEVVLAKVDGPSEPRLMRALDVHGFPSFHWYAYGRERKYGGGRRNDSMVEWVSYHARKDAFHEVSSTREAEDLLTKLNATEAVVGRFVSRWSPEATAFMIGAEEEDSRGLNKSMVYVMVLEHRGLGALKLGSHAGEEAEVGQLKGPAIGPSIYMIRSEDAGGGFVHYGRSYKPPRWDTMPPDRRYSLFDPDRIKAWVATFRMPKVIPLTRYWNKVLASPVRNQTLMFSDAGMPGHKERIAAFELVAERWFGKVLFLEIPSAYMSCLYVLLLSCLVWQGAHPRDPECLYVLLICLASVLLGLARCSSSRFPASSQTCSDISE
jgi:protein disulfide-isomerase-like protein